MARLSKKLMIPLHEARAKADVERVYGNPTPKRDLTLKRRSLLIGRLLNLSIVRPHKGKILGRDFGKIEPYARQDIINARKVK